MELVTMVLVLALAASGAFHLVQAARLREAEDARNIARRDFELAKHLDSLVEAECADLRERLARAEDAHDALEAECAQLRDAGQPPLNCLGEIRDGTPISANHVSFRVVRVTGDGGAE